MRESKFTGGILGMIGTNILCAIIVFCTLFIATPWAVCIKRNWITKHTYIEGRRLAFDGTGLQLFGKYILWLLLTFITFGIYSFWLTIKMQQWIAKHTYFDSRETFVSNSSPSVSSNSNDASITAQIEEA